MYLSTASVGYANLPKCSNTWHHFHGQHHGNMGRACAAYVCVCVCWGGGGGGEGGGGGGGGGHGNVREESQRYEVH